MNNDQLNLIKRLKSIADIGLLYNQNDYDRERYTEILQISYELSHAVTGLEIASLKKLYLENKEYPTPKVDIRALIVQENKVLLVQESADGKWSLPGGWADIGYSPKEVIIKECMEETGLQVIPERLLAVFDKKFHPHPAELFYVYKMVFYCSAVSTTIQKGFDVLDIQYFDISSLPELSAERILKSQLELVFDKAARSQENTYFD